MKAELELVMLKNDVVTASNDDECGCDFDCPTDADQMNE